MKETMSNIDIRLILPELQKAAEGAFIKNVYQYGDIFVLKLYQPSGGTYQLLLQLGRRIHLTEYRRKAPRFPPKFCSALRKYLRDRRISFIQQHDLDRIVILGIGEGEDSFKLVVELFGNGNLLLLDPKNVIFVARRYRKMRDRDVIPKAQYVFPPPRGVDVLEMDEHQFKQLMIESKANVVRTLSSRFNLDSLSCEEICAISGVSPRTSSSDLDNQALDDLKMGLKTYIERLKTGINQPRIIQGDADDEENGFEPLAFVPFQYETYSDSLYTVFDTFSETIDEYFGVSEVEEETVGEDPATRERQRLQKIIEKQSENITKLEIKAGKNRETGDLIYSHFPLVQEVLDSVKKARSDGLSWEMIMQRIEEGKKKELDSALKIVEIMPSKATVVIKLNDTDVPLDIRLNAQDNASKAYEQAKKFESKVAGAKRQIEKTRTKIEKLDASIVEPEKKPLIVKIRKKHWYEKFRWFKSSEGFLVLGGRDVKSNERLVKRHMNANDVFLHAALHGAPYTLIKVPSEPPGEQTLKEAAQFAVTFSRAWQDGLSHGEVYWVNPEQVSFSPPSGEYLPAGGVMIYGSKNYIRKAPVELAVGLLFEGEQAVPMSGPLSAVEVHTDYYIRVMPNGMKKGKLVKMILKQLRNLVPKKKIKIVESIPHEDIMRVLPAGEGKIIPQK